MKTSYHFLKIILFGGILFFLNNQKVNAQFLKNLQNQVSQSVQQTTSNQASTDASNTTDSALNKSTRGVKSIFKRHKKDKNKNNQPGGTTSSTANVNTNSTATPGGPSISSYQNYDFVPGDTVLFADDFTADQDGEFPSQWILKKGQAVVNLVAGDPAFCLTQGNYCEVYPRMTTATYLTDPFTIEFDTYCDGDGNQGSPVLFLTYTDKNGSSTDGEVDFDKGDNQGRGDVTLSGFPNSGLTSSLPQQLIASYQNQWHHCAIIYKDGQLKCYVDQDRILIQPNLGCVPTSFWFGGIGDQTHPIVITNIQVAAGGNMNMIGKNFTESKIITHGITFDINKSDLKPQSMGTLNMIVGVMNANPSLKFEIGGYTDNTGQADQNKTLSQQRADAVKSQLINMGIDGSRLTTKGFGDTKPIGSNETPEGKANNRRVEFVRM